MIIIIPRTECSLDFLFFSSPPVWARRINLQVRQLHLSYFAKNETREEEVASGTALATGLSECNIDC